MTLLAYKPDAQAVLGRLGSLYGREAGDRIFARMEISSEALRSFAAQYAEGFCDYPPPEERIEFWDRLLRERAAVEDDSIPSAYLSEMDQGLYGGVLGGRVQFMAHRENGWISSMVPALLGDWSELDGLRFEPSHPWFQRYLRQLRLFAERSRGRFGVSHFILIDGLNFAFELVGATNTYLSLDQRPETVRRAIDFAFELNRQIQQAFFDDVPLLAGGTASNMAEWLPGRIISESVDPFHMTSRAYFESWGREPVERILGCFDGGVIHIHGNGRHLLEAVRTLRGLKAIFLGDDKGFPPAIDVLASLQRLCGDVPLVVEVGYAGFCQRLAARLLPGGVLYKVQGVPSAAEANRLMRQVRQYRWRPNP
jgi:hypothetical protein